MTPEELSELRVMRETFNRNKTGVVLTDRLMALAIYCGIRIYRTPIWADANPIFKRYEHPDDYEGTLFTASIGSNSPYKMLEYNTNWNWLIQVVHMLACDVTVDIYDINVSVLNKDIEKTFELCSDVVMKKLLGN